MPSTEKCDFYTCLEAEYHCNGTEYSYPITYGLKYCQAYTDNLSKFSTKGKTWISAVRLCLQEALLKDADCNADCKKVQDDAFASHEHCYVDNGVCDLPLDDWIAIFETVGIETLVSTFQAFESSIDTASECYGLWALQFIKDFNMDIGRLKKS
jgi:hypothetical protein